MLSAGILMMVMAFIVIKLNLAGIVRLRLPWMVIIAALTSILIGTVITALTGRKILAPITSLSDATQEIAKGNFNVELGYENHRVRELGEMAVNFNKMARELAGIETLRSDFVANVSHEFKTPIAAIEGYASLMQSDDLTTEERKDYSRLIMESTKQLSSLSSNILRLSKLENQELVPELNEFDLAEQLRQALLLLEPQWSEKQLELDIELAPARYLGSEELLMQIWLNLLANAIKFTAHGGSVAVALTADADAIRVRIADTGIGMSEEVQKHIFEKFYQGDRSRSREGNGLGLALVRRILDLSGGSIRVVSAPGAGAAFTVELPRG